MAKDLVTITGTVVDVINSDSYKVRLDTKDKREIIAHVSGKMRLHKIQILQGDSVTVELSTYDLTHGRITYRNK
ncbi:MAG: translation initiation factor IF-1 [Malacoplasma sp.]|nr:translation initiation factor IF-1 [Mycoplasmataceae bacterium]MDD7685939.1 translation initiation factor IF-1 [Mycoplasmataceae bacterium]MDY2887632.1 translation initiation factor IF-1 [Malacoplasma sp.]